MMLREVNCEVLSSLAEKDSRIVVLDADLMNSSGFGAFQKKYPERTINCGIQESNMIGLAGGLSAMGMIPVTHSFASFASRRAADQVFMAGVYNRQNIKMFGSDPGACGSPNGGTHMALEDIGIMRSLPGVRIVDPTDEKVLRDVLPQIMSEYGMFYIRLFRKSKRVVYSGDIRFSLGKAHTAREGNDITIIASGALMVPEALRAAEQLASEGIEAMVLDMFTIEPLDSGAVLTAAKRTGAVLTAENHSIYNGLGTAVAEVLAENALAVPFSRIGFLDTVGETGTMDYIMKKFELDADSITRRARQLVAAKQTN
jgi:transketolase